MSRPLRYLCGLAALLVAHACSLPALGDEAADERQFNLVAQRYWRILQARPRRDTAFDLWYAHYLDAGKLDDLVEQVRRHAEDRAEDPAAQLLWGLVQERRGEEAAALEAYAAAEKLAKENYYPTLLRGLLLLRQQQQEEAAAALAHAISLKPPRAELLNTSKRLARLYLQMGRASEALKTLSELAAQFPGDRHVLDELAHLLADEKQYDESIRRFEQVAGLAKDDPYQALQAQIEIAQLMLLQGRRRQGLELLERALDETRPDSWLERDLRRRIEQTFLQTDDLAGLIDWCEERLKNKPHDLQALVQSARALRQLGKTVEALARFEQAVRLAPSRRDVREALVDCLVAAGKGAEAIQQCQQLAQQHPQDIDVLLRLGRLQLEVAGAEDRSAAQQRAVEVWKQMAALRPQDANLAVQAAEACRQAGLAGRFSAALEGELSQPQTASLLLTAAESFYREAVRRALDQPQYYEYLGEFLHSQARREEAVAAWAKIAALPSPSAESWHRLAEICANFNCLPEAVEACRQSLTYRPDDFGQRDFHLRLLVRDKDLPAALAEADHLDRLAGDETLREKALKRRVEVYAAGGRVDEEIDRLQKAAARLTLHEQWLLGLLLAERRRYPEAAAALGIALERAGDHLPLAVAYAEALKRAGRLGEAVERYEHLARLNPSHRFGYYQEIIDLQLQRRRPEQARAAADTLVRISPSNLEAYRVRAAVAFQAKDVQQGLRDLRHAVKLAPGNAHLRAELAEALADHRQHAEALEHYWRAFELTEKLDGKRDLIAALVDTAKAGRQVDDVIEQLQRLRAGRMIRAPSRSAWPKG